jgi:hypothetical protein
MQAVPPMKTVGKLFAAPKFMPLMVIVASPINGPFAGTIPRTTGES